MQDVARSPGWTRTCERGLDQASRTEDVRAGEASGDVGWEVKDQGASLGGGGDAFVAKLVGFGSQPPPSLAPVLVPVDGAVSAGEESIATTTGGGEVPVLLGAPPSAQRSVAPAPVVPASGPSTHGRTPGGTTRLGRRSPQFVDPALADFETLSVDDLVLARLATALPSAFPG